MFSFSFKKYSIQYALIVVWMINCLLASFIAIKEIWIPYMSAGNDSYSYIKSEIFDGTTMPIAYIPDWSKAYNQDKTKLFDQIPISEYIPTPLYDARSLEHTQGQDKNSLIAHYTYITPYM
jgi:hypothetical protein